MGRVKYCISHSNQVNWSSGEISRFKAKVVFSKECSTREHGQHVIEPGPDASEVKLSLLIQVSEWVPQAQVQVGGAQVLWVPGSVEVGGSEGRVGANRACHRALGRQRGWWLQTGGPWHWHFRHRRSFFGLHSLKKVTVLVRVSLRGGRLRPHRGLGARCPGGDGGLGSGTGCVPAGLCCHLTRTHCCRSLSRLCLGGSINCLAVPQVTPVTVEVVFLTDGGGLRVAALGPRLALHGHLWARVGLLGCTWQLGQPHPKQVAQCELLGLWFSVY